ncbi:hypothetical protein N7540_006669 [Penicillium herquei]|nr:hypothetical protein N7540_006669 [Penicillium herquei]
MDTRKDYPKTLLHTLVGRKVVRISEHLVVKSGDDIRVHEGPTLRFIKENTTIPVPDVHDIRWKDGKAMELVMDYMPGEQLDRAWDSLTHDHSKYIGAIDRVQAVIGKRKQKDVPEALEFAHNLMNTGTFQVGFNFQN